MAESERSPDEDGEVRRPHIRRLLRQATGAVPPDLDELAERVTTHFHASHPGQPAAVEREDSLATQTGEGTFRADGETHEMGPRAATRPSLPERVGRWEITARLGEGGMGVVLLGEDEEAPETIARRVAIKIAWSDSENALLRLRREARSLERIHATAHLDCKHVVRLIAAETETNQPWLAMEHLAGDDLSEVLEERGRLSISEALHVALGIACGLRAAHAAGVHHRDLKPANVFILPDGTIKLIDFGLARRVDGEESISVSLTGRAMGTPSYMSPEHVRGAEIKAPSDVYSFGALLFHLLSGRPPFLLREDRRLWDLLSQHEHDPPPSLAEYVDGLPGALDQLVAHCLRKAPSERPSIAELIEVLEGCARGSSEVTQPAELLLLGRLSAYLGRRPSRPPAAAISSAPARWGGSPGSQPRPSGTARLQDEVHGVDLEFARVGLGVPAHASNGRESQVCPLNQSWVDRECCSQGAS